MLTIRVLNREDLKEKRDLIEYSNDSSGRSIILIGMAHAGKPVFYENVRKLLDSLRAEGYVVFHEGVGRTRDMDSLVLDTLQRKFRKILGFHLTDYLNEDNKSRKPYNKKKYIIQSDELLGIDFVSPDCIHADYMIYDLIKRYEQDKGEIILTEYDWNTSLMEKYDPKKSGDTTTYYRRYLVHTLRNEHVAKMIAESPYQKIVILYGRGHMHHIINRELKDSLQLTHNWDREREEKQQKKEQRKKQKKR